MALLLDSLKTNSVFLKNRLIMPPMATSKADDNGKVTPDIINYYKEKTQGGYISLVIIEHSFINKEGKASKNQISLADDNVIVNLKKLAEVIHENNSKAVIQLNHAGSAADKEIINTNPVAPSKTTHPRKENVIPHELTKEEINYIIKSFADAAGRVKEAGFDGVEIHSAHGYLLNQFFSPITNKRTDEYGGNVLNRVRIHLEVIKGVREKVGKDFPVFLRLGASDYISGGITLADSLKAATEFEKAGVDILDISGGLCGYKIPGVTGQGYFAPLTHAIKRKVSIPVILTGGITDAKTAETLLTEGKADLIGVGRAILNDSNWAKEAIKELESM